MDWLTEVCLFLFRCAVVRSYQQQQQLGKPAGESPRVTSPQHDKENVVTSSRSKPRSKSIFGCVELLAESFSETSCTRPPPPPHVALVQPPYLVSQRVDQSASSSYRHVTSRSPAAMFVTSPPPAPPTPVRAIYRKSQRFFFIVARNVTSNIIMTCHVKWLACSLNRF